MQLELFPEQRASPQSLFGNRAALVLTLVLVVFFLWACWATGRILSHRERPIATVDLARVMSDYIREESARDLPPQEAALRAALFARLVEDGVKAIAADGTLVLVSQAVVGRSARDATPDLIRFIDSRTADTPAVPALPPPAAVRPSSDRED